MASPVLPPAAKTRAAEPPADGLTTIFGTTAATYGVDKRSFYLSFLINTLVTVIAVYSSYFVATHAQQIKTQITLAAVEISPYVLPPAKTDSGGGGGGGDRDKLAAP